MDPGRLGLCISAVDDVHRQLDERRDVLVDVAAKVQHDSLGELAATNSVHAAHFLVAEDVFNHAHNGSKIGRILDQHIGTIGHEVVQRWQHVLV